MTLLLKARPAGVSWINEQDSPVSRAIAAVCMPKDHRVRPNSSQLPSQARQRTFGIDDVLDEDAPGGHRNHFRNAVARFKISVPKDRSERRDLVQRLQHLAGAKIPGVQNVVNPCQQL